MKITDPFSRETVPIDEPVTRVRDLNSVLTHRLALVGVIRRRFTHMVLDSLNRSLALPAEMGS